MNKNIKLVLPLLQVWILLMAPVIIRVLFGPGFLPATRALYFMTPTLLAGDRSLVSVVAHELAHSWTGNLVTNANAEHFWLNEGFTMYAERRITEALEGADMAALSAALGRRGRRIVAIELVRH